MDNFSDLLTSFFVSTKTKKKVNESSVKVKSVNESSVKEKSVNEKSVNEKSVNESSVNEKSVKESSNDIFTSDTSESKVQDVQETTTTSSPPHLKSESSDSEQLWEPRKYVLKSTDMSKKNIIITNNEMEENITILSELIDSFSLMKNVKETYDSLVYIVSSSKNQGLFKKMVLENPYIYFTNIVVKRSITPKTITDLGSQEKRTLLILDNNEVEDFGVFEDLIGKNIQIIVLTTEYTSNLVKFYKKMEDNKLILHRRDKLKSLQKKFFNKFVKELCKNESLLCFNDYYKFINQDTFGIRYIIVKNDELRYY